MTTDEFSLHGLLKAAYEELDEKGQKSAFREALKETLPVAILKAVNIAKGVSVS